MAYGYLCFTVCTVVHYSHLDSGFLGFHFSFLFKNHKQIAPQSIAQFSGPFVFHSVSKKDPVHPSLEIVEEYK